MAVAAQNHSAEPVCYSSCPPNVDLKETFHVLHFGAEEIEHFSVLVAPSFIGASPAPTGTVTIKAGSTVLCTITLTPTSSGRGSCSPPASVLPAGHYVVVAYYSGDSNYIPAQSRPQQLEIVHFPDGGGD